MVSRLPSILAWSLLALCLAVEILATWLPARNDPSGIAENVASTIMISLVAVVGTFVALRQPHNPIGWLLGVSVLIQQVGVVALEYGIYILATARSASPKEAVDGAGAAVIGGWLRGLGWLLLPTFLLLLFPDGRPPSRRWRPVVWLATVALAFNATESLFGQDLTDVDNRLAGVRNPFAVLDPDLSNALQGVFFFLFLVVIGLCTAAIVVRFRRSRGQERLQLKWFTYAAALCLLIFLGIAVAAFLNVYPPGILFNLAVVGLPIGAGVAILRHRLYDIDLIIKRTLVYGSLTTILAGLYFGSVVAMQQFVRALAGAGAPQPPVIIVLSTLLIAVLFQPLRQGIQRIIDRRFYRRRYDAARTLASFAETLRQDVDLAELHEHLIVVVEETMHPAHVSLWLRSTGSVVSR